MVRLQSDFLSVCTENCPGGSDLFVTVALQSVVLVVLVVAAVLKLPGVLAGKGRMLGTLFLTPKLCTIHTADGSLNGRLAPLQCHWSAMFESSWGGGDQPLMQEMSVVKLFVILQVVSALLLALVLLLISVLLRVVNVEKKNLTKKLNEMWKLLPQPWWLHHRKEVRQTAMVLNVATWKLRMQFWPELLKSTNLEPLKLQSAPVCLSLVGLTQQCFYFHPQR
mmetsp:Transcript_10834/g.20586  ORF Transcript_10834/g.20586 Transcript_10834/m.20586 type:complete len:222 (+) Transcript_10834:942-1607(+)